MGDLQWESVFHCKYCFLFDLFFKLTHVFNNTATTFGLSGCTYISTMQDQPMVYIYFEFFRYYFFELFFHRDHIFTHGEFSAIRYAKYMRINGDYWPAKTELR
ncbi:hypothetical protein JL49_17405 [Pseudoalteromonas luteoviolacea]|nr:hypothetical protein JL49_17405 [Pseudoalteromonas luteoviolacea]